MEPKISVIVPVYKCEKYIEQCIQSVLNQTFNDFELILVDDGSPDNAPKICDEYATRDSRIKVIHKKNGGVSSARNVGMDNAQGKYIMFIDSDDYIEKNFFEYAYKESEKENIDLFVSGLIMEWWKNGKLIKTQPYSIKQSLIYETKELLEQWNIRYPDICLCGPWCKLYKQNLIRENHLRFDENLTCGEDTYFNLQVLRHVKNIYFSEKIFYHYVRENSDSLFSRFHENIYEIHFQVSNAQIELMKYMNCETSSIETYISNYYFNCLLGGVFRYFRYYQDKEKKKRLNLLKKISSDKYIQKSKILKTVGIKKKLLLFLFKLKSVHLLFFLFNRKKFD